MQAEQQSERERFEVWAKDEGYDTANTYDTERSRWIWLSPMTADLWKCWRAALSHPSPQWLPIETCPIDTMVIFGPTKRMTGPCIGMHHSRDGWVTETPSEWASIYPPKEWMPLDLPPHPEQGSSNV